MSRTFFCVCGALLALVTAAAASPVPQIILDEIQIPVPQTRCDVPCPDGAVLEQEACGESTNGGCGMPVPTFEPIQLDTPVCGTAWAVDGTRDTDWYEIVITEPMMFTWAVEAEFDTLGVVCGLVATAPPGNPDCYTASSLDPYAIGGECEPISVTTNCMPAGTYWFFVSTLDFYGLPCGDDNAYVATLSAVACDVWGACCYDDGHDCLDTSELECDALGGIWHVNETCATYICRVPCDPDTEATINIVIHTDNYPSETTWEVINHETGETMCSGGPYDMQQNTYEEQCCVPLNGCWDFTIYDAYGDGICCSYGQGYYAVYFEDELICTGGEFDDEESCLSFGDMCTPRWGACCVGDDCVGELYDWECDALDGRLYLYRYCSEVDCACDADFCVVAPYQSPPLSTCGAGNDCALRDTEEHVYRVEIPWAANWTFSLCGSAFDTYLYLGTTYCGQEIGYNDDFCGLQSEITAYLEPGYYYATIEGYSGCGDYVLDVMHVEHCNFECPPGGTPEGEPDCHDNYIDVTNSGCGGEPPVFSPITCNETICGTSGTYLYNGNNYRDTDWYEIELPAPTALEWFVCADFPVLIMIIDANQGGCVNPVILDYDESAQGLLASCSANVTAGTYWLWVGPGEFAGIPCGSPYVATLYTTPDVCICGDFDNDADVDVDDFYFFLDTYGSCNGDLIYRDECDFDGDGCITLVDYQSWMDCYRNQ